MKQKHSASYLARWYTILSTIALVSVFQALFFPRWPKVEPINSREIASLLTSSGLSAKLYSVQDPQRTYDIDKSSILSYRMNNGDTLRILHARVRERTNFNVQFISAENSAILLKSSKPTDFNTSTLEGRIGNQPALQTCLVKGSPRSPRHGLSFHELGDAVDQRDGNYSNLLFQIIGLRPNRSYDCYLITYISSSQQQITGPDWLGILETLNQ